MDGFGAFLSALEAHRSGSSWMARCPAHDDRNASLSIRFDNGKLLVHCHAGCPQTAVIARLAQRGLWHRPTFPAPHRLVEVYEYTDAQHELLYQVLRYEPKSFRQRRPDGHGGWVWKRSPRQVLYRLPELIASPRVFVVEGERDVESLRSRSFVATTNAGGASAPWLSSYTEVLRGKEVWILPDADTPGRVHAAKVARSLLGAAARLTILELPGAKDVTEWFEQGHSECELISMLN